MLGYLQQGTLYVGIPVYRLSLKRSVQERAQIS